MLSHTESSTEPRADNSASRSSFFAMSCGSVSFLSVPFAVFCDVGPEVTVGAWRSGILRPMGCVTAQYTVATW